MCKLTSMERPCSLKFKYSDTKIRCEEELIGKNSVIPWINDNINISITFIKINSKVVNLLAMQNAYQVCKK